MRPRDIQQAMLDTNAQIVHFSGQGTEDEGLRFADETGQAKLVSGEALAGLFELFAEQVECVVLSGCYLEMQAEAIAQHIKYVIGISRELGQAATEFAVDFYDALGAERPIEFAYKFGCAAIRLVGVPEHLSPILKKKPNSGQTVATLRLPQEQSSGKNQTTSIPSTQAVEVFFSYAHEDEDLRNELEKHLTILKRQGVITAWHDREISAGTEWAGEIDAHLNTAQVILLLISADFLASNYCYDIELTRAMERHAAREACVIPIILREVDWKGAHFGKLQALPTNAEPVNNWASRDQAFADIARGIRKVVEELKKVDSPQLPDATEPADQNELLHEEHNNLPDSPLPIIEKPAQVMSNKPEEKPSQSISISGGQVSGQFGQAGRDLNQTQQLRQGASEKQLTPVEVAELLAQIEILFRNSDLSEEQKEKALKHLETAKEEIQETEPDKNFAAKSLRRAIKALKEADDIGVGQGVWQKLELITSKLIPWFGVAAHFFEL